MSFITFPNGTSREVPPDPAYLAALPQGWPKRTGFDHLRALLSTAISGSGWTGAQGPWHIYSAGIETGHDPIYMAYHASQLATAGWFASERDLILRHASGENVQDPYVQTNGQYPRGYEISDLWKLRFSEWQAARPFVPITAEEVADVAQLGDDERARREESLVSVPQALLVESGGWEGTAPLNGGAAAVPDGECDSCPLVGAGFDAPGADAPGADGTGDGFERLVYPASPGNAALLAAEPAAQLSISWTGLLVLLIAAGGMWAVARYAD